MFQISLFKLTASSTRVVVGGARRVVVVTPGIGRGIGYIVGGQFAALTRFLRIGVCISREGKIKANQ